MGGLEILQKAGVVGYLIFALSVVALAIILEKLYVLRLRKLVPKDDLRLLVEFFGQGDIGSAVELCRKRKNLLSRIVIETVRNMGQQKKENFLHSFEVSARRYVIELERGLTLLATTAAVSPLLGLLGTVLGMVKIFGVMTGNGAIGNPQQLSAGVAEALLTTIMGLLVAIPAIVMYNIFNKKLDKIATELEAAGILLANNFKGLS
jgi:biopolymer transport protein ExbB